VEHALCRDRLSSWLKPDRLIFRGPDRSAVSFSDTQELYAAGPYKVFSVEQALWRDCRSSRLKLDRSMFRGADRSAASFSDTQELYAAGPYKVFSVEQALWMDCRSSGLRESAEAAEIVCDGTGIAICG
jgi:hypothetical protein